MNNETNMKTTRLGWLALFTSMGTLLCCALPIVLVTVGFGAAVASLTFRFPVLVLLAEQEIWMFGISGLLLTITAWFNHARSKTCPTDPGLAAQCQRINRWNRKIFWSAVIMWLIGFFARFLLLPVAQWLGY